LHAPRDLTRDYLSRRNAGFFVAIVLYMRMPLYSDHAIPALTIGKRNMIDVDYLDRLAADQIDAGFDLTGADIKSAAVEIRRLRLVVENLENAATVPSLNDALSATIRHEIENFDFSAFGFADSDSVRNIVQQMSSGGEIESTPDSDQVEDAVREMIRMGSITIQADIELEC